MNKKFALLVAMAFLSVFSFCPRSHAADFPSVSFLTLLDGVRLAPQNGMFYFSTQLFATNLPKEGYGAYGGGGLWAIVRTADGTDLYKIEFSASRSFNEAYFEMTTDTLDILAPGWETAADEMGINKPGAYLMDFYLEGKLFYTFPFSVSQTATTLGEQFLFLDGAWSDWICLSYDRGDPESTLRFYVWLRNKDSESKDIDFRVKIFNKNGGALTCMSFTTSTTLRTEWHLFDEALQFPPKEGETYGEYVYAKHLLAKDGNYTAKVFVGGQVYGEYDFSVSGGKFNHTGRTDRATADPLTFVEGANDCFWYKRS